MSCLFSGPARAHYGPIDLPRICFCYDQKDKHLKYLEHLTEERSHRLYPCASDLLFVWRDVDAICHVVTLRGHFDLFGTVVHNVSPGLRQKNLHKGFHKTIAEVVVVGCVEGIRCHGDDVVHAAKSRSD